MNKLQDLGNANNNDATILDEDNKFTYLLTRAVDKITESEMKKVEELKMEDDLTIKRLERESFDIERKLVYWKQKLKDARKNQSTQVQILNQLVQLNKAILEKYNELKRFQDEIVQANLKNAEIKYENCIIVITQFSGVLKTISGNEDNIKLLKKEKGEKKNKLNEDIMKQIEERKNMSVKNIESLTELKKIGPLKAQLNKMKDEQKDIKNIIEKKKEGLIEVAAEGEDFLDKVRQESQCISQEKTNLIKDLDNKEKIIVEKTNLITTLQSKLHTLEQKMLASEEYLNNIIVNKETNLEKLTKNKKCSEISKMKFDETVKKITEEQTRIIEKLVIVKDEFFKEEENLQRNLENERKKIEEQKSLNEKYEIYEDQCKKLEETKLSKQKELSGIERDFKDNMKILTDEIKKNEQLLFATNVKRRPESDVRIQELQEKRNNLKQKLMSYNQVKVNAKTSDNLADIKTDIPNYKAPPNSQSSQKKPIYHPDTIDNQLEYTTVKITEVAEKTPNYFDDSEESEDEFSITNRGPLVKSIESVSILPRKATDYDVNLENSVKTLSLSQSDELFNKMMESTPTPAKDKDVFKIPRSYMAPCKNKKTLQNKKI